MKKEHEYLKIDGTILKGVKRSQRVPAELEIPDGVTEISANAFTGCRFSSMTIPGSVIKIDRMAFGFSVQDSTICFGGRIENLNALTSFSAQDYTIRFDGTLAQWNSLIGLSGDNDYDQILAHIYVMCTDGEQCIEVQNGLTIAGSFALELANKKIQNAVIPDGIKKICFHAFYNSSIRSIEIPASVSEIGREAFANCTYLESVKFGGTLEQWRGIEGLTENISLLRATVTCTDGTQAMEIRDGLRISCGTVFGLANELTIPDGISKIASSAFYNYEHLRRITIPSSVTKIGHDVVRSCRCLIMYNGTVEQWDKIKKYNDSFHVYTIVYCTDGKLMFVSDSCEYRWKEANVKFKDNECSCKDLNKTCKRLYLTIEDAEIQKMISDTEDSVDYGIMECMEKKGWHLVTWAQ